MNLGILGSRNLVGIKIYEFIKAEIIKKNPDLIVTSGEIKGVCEYARMIAQELKIPLLTYFYDFHKYNKGCFEKRSEQIIKNSEQILVFHDGKSKGTINEIKLLKKLNRKYEYFLIKKEHSLGFQEEEINIDELLNGIRVVV
jgi:hypothetical protein